MIYDITSIQGVINFLTQITGYPEYKLRKYIAMNGADMDTFINEYNISLDSFEFENIEVVFQHITTSIDDNKTLLKKGIISLKEVFRLNTALKRYIESEGISIDVDKLTLTYQNKLYDIDYSNYNEQHYEGVEKNLNQLHINFT